MAELPGLADLASDPSDGFRVLTINVGGNADIAAGLAAEFGERLDYAVDQLALTATRYKVRVFPTMVVIDRRGHVISRRVGAFRKADLMAAIVSP